MATDFVKDYGIWIQNFIATLVGLSKEIGDQDLIDQMELVNQVAYEQLNILHQASAAAQTNDKQTIQEMAKPMSNYLTRLVDFANLHRKSTLFNQFFAISEGSLAFNWIFVVRSIGIFHS
jgi:hypothetical protein